MKGRTFGDNETFSKKSFSAERKSKGGIYFTNFDKFCGIRLVERTEQNLEFRRLGACLKKTTDCNSRALLF